MNCTSDWSIPFSGTKRWVLFDPDMNATAIATTRCGWCPKERTRRA